MRKTSKLWNDFIAFQAKKEKEFGCAEGLFSQSFMSVDDLNHPQNNEELATYIKITLEGKDDAIIAKALSSFVYLGQARGDGGLYGFLTVNEGNIDENPVVFFDSDGYDNIVAQNFKELLTLLSIDVEPMVGYDDDEQTSFLRDEDEEHSGAYDEYIEWLEQQNITVIANEHDYENIAIPLIDNAVKVYGEVLKEILPSD